MARFPCCSLHIFVVVLFQSLYYITLVHFTDIALTFQRRSCNNHTFPSTLFGSSNEKSRSTYVQFTMVMKELSEIHDVVLIEQDVEGG